MAAASHDDPAVRVMLAVRGEDNLWGRRVRRQAARSGERIDREAVHVEAIDVQMFRRPWPASGGDVRLPADLGAPPQPLPLTVAMSYSATMRMRVWRGSTTNIPPPRSVTKAKRPSSRITGQMGGLSGRTFGAWHEAPLGVWQVAKSSVAAPLLGLAAAAPGRTQIDPPLNVIVILADDLSLRRNSRGSMLRQLEEAHDPRDWCSTCRSRTSRRHCPACATP